MAQLRAVIVLALTGFAGAVSRSELKHPGQNLDQPTCDYYCQIPNGLDALSHFNEAFHGLDVAGCIEMCHTVYGNVVVDPDSAPVLLELKAKIVPKMELQKCKSECQRFGMKKLASENPAFTGISMPQDCVKICDKEYGANLVSEDPKKEDDDHKAWGEDPIDDPKGPKKDEDKKDEEKKDEVPSSFDPYSSWEAPTTIDPKLPTTPTTTTTKNMAEEEWVRPFSLTNGACEHVDEAGDKDRWVMDIRQVAGGSFYLGEIGFGMPEQKLNMLLDTGSDEIVIKSSDCQGCKGRGYNSKMSRTYLNETNGPQKGLTSMSYGSGDVIGQRGFDTVHTGPLSGHNLPIVYVKESNIDMFQDDSHNALEVILGMAPGLREYVGERLASAMHVRRFTQCLPNNADEDGLFVVNDHKPEGARYTGPYNSVGSYYWAAGIQNFRFEWKGLKSIGKKPIALGKPFVGIIDTGTTLLSLPQSVMTELNTALESIENDCSRMQELPDLMFEIDGHKHALPPKAYISEASNQAAFHTTAMNRLRTAHSAFPSLRLKEHLESITAEEAAAFSAVTEHLYFKKPFLNLKKGSQCMLLFTQPLNMQSPEGELGILGMAFFREYAIHFDFCSRQMWTSRSYGDCSGNVGQHPDNVDFCGDKAWLDCWSEGVKDFFDYVADGWASIFGSRERALPKDHHKKNPPSKKKEKFTMVGEASAYTDDLFQMDPKTIRHSEAAKWLQSTKTEGGMVEI